MEDKSPTTRNQGEIMKMRETISQLEMKYQQEIKNNEKYKNYYKDKGPTKNLIKLLKGSYFLGILRTFQNKAKERGAIRQEVYSSDLNLLKKDEDENEQNQQHQNTKKRRKLLPILPDNRIKMIWDILLIISLIFYAVLSPLYINIIELDGKDEDYEQYELFVSTQFMIDIVINMVTAYVDENKKLITNPYKIFMNYLHGWFVLDFLSAFPFQAFKLQGAQYVQFLKYIKLPRLYKLQKITSKQYQAYMIKLQVYLYQILNQLNINFAFFNLVTLLIIVFFANHYAGCFYFGTQSQKPTSQQWMYSKNLQDSSAWSKYVASLEWSFQTWTTVGFGDLSPISYEEQQMAIIWMIVGAGFFYPYILSESNTFFKQMFFYQYQFDEMRQSFNQSARSLKFNSQLQDNVNSFIDVNSKMKVYSWIDKNKYLNELPQNLRKELILHCYKNIISKIQFFDNDINFTMLLLNHLYFFKYQEKEIVYRKNDIANEVYFILEGEMRLCKSNGQNFYIYNQGDICGEIELIKNIKRECFMQARKDCLVLICKKKQFINILQDFPFIQDELNTNIENKIKKLSLCDKMATDFQNNKIINRDLLNHEKMKNTFQIHKDQNQYFIDKMIKNNQKQDKSCLSFNVFKIFSQEMNRVEDQSRQDYIYQRLEQDPYQKKVDLIKNSMQNKRMTNFKNMFKGEYSQVYKEFVDNLRKKNNRIQQNSQINEHKIKQTALQTDYYQTMYSRFRKEIKPKFIKKTYKNYRFMEKYSDQYSAYEDRQRIQIESFQDTIQKMIGQQQIIEEKLDSYIQNLYK